MMDKIINKTLSKQVLEILRERILTGTLKPEDRLLYVTVAEELQVSLSPVKEALVYLEQEGLVTLIPRKGAFVRKISDEDILEYSWIRLSLESLAVEWICKMEIPPEMFDRLCQVNSELALATAQKDQKRCVQLDNEFHQDIVAMSNMPRLAELVKKLPLVNLLAVAGKLSYLVNSGEHICQTHAEIVAALRAKNASKAKDLLLENIILPLTNSNESHVLK